MIEWISLSQGGKVNAVDPATNTLITDFGNHTAQVANVIPPQRAGRIAEIAGATDKTGWCAIDPVTFESRSAPNIHVIGDACLAGAMPKSAFSANAQAKACAARDCHADIRRIARRAEADQYLLQPGGPRLRHLGRRRLPAQERSCWPTSKAPAASVRSMRHAISARAKPTMRNPGSRPLRRKSLARRAHRISGPILAGALLALPGRGHGASVTALRRRRRRHSGTAHECARRRCARARARRRTFQHLHPLPQRPISRTEIPGRPGA